MNKIITDPSQMNDQQKKMYADVLKNEAMNQKLAQMLAPFLKPVVKRMTYLEREAERLNRKLSTVVSHSSKDPMGDTEVKSFAYGDIFNDWYTIDAEREAIVHLETLPAIPLPSPQDPQVIGAIQESKQETIVTLLVNPSHPLFKMDLETFRHKHKGEAVRLAARAVDDALTAWEKEQG